ncbi:MAG TPA: 4Fe-4S binding protein, partial [Dehalococcoidales bacterium]|nr:4Fe-4S binding protein [Dehalococcoidales bacterium]
TAADAARYALRLGVREVHMVYRGTREEMRASREELEGALEEGTILHTGIVPGRVIGEGGRVSGLEILATRSRHDETGRRTLETVPGSESVIDCSSVIMAIGQASDLGFIRPKDGIKISPRGTIIADDATLATTAPGVFAGGDVVYGPRTLIEAIADGHRAARAMDNYLKNGREKVTLRARMVPVTPAELPLPGSRQTRRVSPPKIPLDRRTGVSEVEMVYDEAAAREQAGRCLKCHIQTVFNGDLCILCGGCVDVCPWNCFKMVSLDRIDGDPEVRKAVLARYGLALDDFKSGSETLKMGTAMIKDETLCTRCGLCAERCPTGAITMEAFSFEESTAPDAGASGAPGTGGAG